MRHVTRIAIALPGCFALTVLLQAQGPIFEGAAPIQIGRGSGQLTLIDTNSDTHLDLVVSRYQHGIDVRLGNGRGRFSPTPGGPLDLKIDPAATVLGDVVDDGQPDLIAAFRDKTSEYLQVFRGDGQGRFGPGGTKRFATSKASEFYKPAIRLADVDGNGTTDIITSNGRRNTIEILLGNERRGTGPAFTVAPTVSLTPGSSFWTFGAGDIDGDGHVDLVTTVDPPGESAARIEVRRGVGNGRFQEPSGGVSVPPGARIATVADLNGDSGPDVVVSHADTGLMSILLNNGRGAKQLLTAQPPRDLGLQTFGVAVADINRDRRVDIVATTVNSRVRPYESKVAMLLGGSFALAAATPFPVGNGAYQLAVGDINEDGKPDVVTSSFEGESLSVLLGR